ncbi:sugar transferase [Nocardioides dongkuii]|uniref:sugar transferase n=1 Tax=Nocardioides dongkuii TaxID=2760089 RepID=UPI0015FA41C0|nr:sugar transferase [Nocardioides dongkuii]
MTDVLLPLPLPAGPVPADPLVLAPRPLPGALDTRETPARPATRPVPHLLPALCDITATLAGVAALLLVGPAPGPVAVVGALLLWAGLLLADGQAWPPDSERARADRLRALVRPAGVLALCGCVAAELPDGAFPLSLASGLTSGQALALAAALAVPVAVARLLLPAPASTPVVVAGASSATLDHVTAAFRRAQPRGDVRPVLVAGPSAEEEPDRPSCGLLDLPAVADRAGARVVVLIPSDSHHPPVLRRLQWELEASGRRLLLAPGPLDVAPTRATTWHVEGQPLVEVRPSRHAARLRTVTWVPERILAAIALCLISPVLLAVTILIRLESPGPALFRQVRVGQDGREFVIYKFRTMRADPGTDVLVNEADGVLFKIRRDPRITRLGAHLRRYSIDELPQLANVVLGDMSLVGPRPALPAEVAAYDGDTRRRLAVRPGLTGLWQVSGRSDLSWQDTVRLDLHYVDNWSFRLDLRILRRTVGAVLTHRGAY